MENKKQTVRLSNYSSSPFQIDKVKLTFRLSPENTTVLSKLSIIRLKKNIDLKLDGKCLILKSVKIDQKPVSFSKLSIESEHLEIPHNLIPNSRFSLEIETEINPSQNTSLEGLYISSGIYCTQCEAEGFRKITYFLDRPDIMARFYTRIESSLTTLLSNGNIIYFGKGFAEWYDPWPKPSYLFALVAGNLETFEDHFITGSGRKIILKIFSKDKGEIKFSHAMESIKKAMRWDEKVYGREYDLDIFMIVAVDDFNMGAMENKGLNIFNSKYIVANPDTATDTDYQFIERIIAHEYFHNWTGNRITCRDWFQLSLKEGLTVFRDQEFAGDMGNSSIKRIEDVITLKNRQFREDDGALAHPVRPSEYIEINNFYTSTVYEKGAELVRMLQLLVGEEKFKKAMGLYFEKFDGKACTIEDWLDVFKEISTMNIDQFLLWYVQKGRPVLEVSENFENGKYKLSFIQYFPNQNDKELVEPMIIPVKASIYSKDGKEVISDQLLICDEKESVFDFTGFSEKPITSLLRDFSAPVTLKFQLPIDEGIFLLRNDSNLFRRWEISQNLSSSAIFDFISFGKEIPFILLKSFSEIIFDESLHPAFRSLFCSAPSQEDLFTSVSQSGQKVYPNLLRLGQDKFNFELAKYMAADLPSLFSKVSSGKRLSKSFIDMGLRKLSLSILNLISYLDNRTEKARIFFDSAGNMTEELGALKILVYHDSAQTALKKFYNKWEKNKLVIDKWFSVQAAFTPPEKAIKVVTQLSQHRDFNIQNPNRFRCLVGSFSTHNLPAFHQDDGTGYEFVAKWLIKLDSINPQIAARTCSVFDNWRHLNVSRQEKINNIFQRISNSENLSKNTFEIINKLVQN